VQKSVPQELKGVIFERDVDGEHVVQPVRRFFNSTMIR
jgi:hypothetical protein